MCFAVAVLIACVQFQAFAQEEVPQEPAKPAAAGVQDTNLGEEIKSMVKRLNADDWQTRESATKRLIEIGAPALSAVSPLRNSEDLEIKNRVEKILATLHYVSPEDCSKIDELVKKYKAKDKEEADTDEQKKNKKKAVREIVDEMKKVKFSDFHLVSKLKPAAESDKKLIAEILGGLLNLSYWTGADGYHVAGNKIVMEDGEEIPMPAGPWRIQEMGDKIYVNGQELALPTKIEKDIPPVAVLGKIVGGGQGNIELKLDALKILEEMKDRQAVQFVIRAFNVKIDSEHKENLKLAHEVLSFLSKIVKDGPTYTGAGDDVKKLQEAASSWKKWWRKSSKEDPVNK